MTKSEEDMQHIFAKSSTVWLCVKCGEIGFASSGIYNYNAYCKISTKEYKLQNLLK